MASGRVAREAAVYPFQVCRAILRGCVSQLKKDCKTNKHLYGIQDCWEPDSQSVEYENGSSGPAEFLAMNGMKPVKVFRDAVTG